MLDELFDLTTKTALITGASSGLGERFALTLADRGAKVILAARRLDLLKKLAKQIEATGGKAISLTMDVSNKDSVKEAIKSLQEEKIDIVINNAGIYRKTPIFGNEENEIFEEVMQTNLMGVWYVTKEIANHMKNNNIAGSIINIASVYGDNKLGINSTSYCASKAAVIQLTKALVGELAAYNIRINTIAPGYVSTPMTEPNVRENIKKFNPLGYIAHPNDFDGIILYLASNRASSYVTGACFTIDGGVSWGGIY